MGVIFYLSAQKGDASDELSMGFTSMLFGDDFALLFNTIVRETGHIIEFAVFSLPVLLFFSTFKISITRSYYAALLFCIIYAVSDEVHQIFVEGRAYEFLDIVADVLGALFGLSFLRVILVRFFTKTIPAPDKTESGEINKLVVDAFASFVNNEAFSGLIDSGNAQAFIEKSMRHKILPMTAPAFVKPENGIADGLKKSVRNEVISEVVLQTRKTVKFIQAYKSMLEKGAKPLCVKGIICRALYPDFDLRISSDEDLAASDADYSVCVDVLKSLGFEIKGDDNGYETSFYHAESGCMIELHHTLFPDDGGVYSAFNSALGNLFENPASVRIEQTEVFCPCADKHFLYLVLHAFKHFLISGVGIRQIADISLFATANKTDWQKIFDDCEKLKLSGFLSSVLLICSVYFNFDISSVKSDKFNSTLSFEPMLDDILCGGVYGPDNLDHLHAGVFTFNGYSEMLGIKKRRSTALIPPKEKIVKKYPFAKKYPVLLPAAYFMRLFSYAFSSHSTSAVFDSARRRKDLMKIYGINK
jgi:VanZ family protein